ncbi:MAG: DsrE family protein [Acidiferrobacterales bacterium]
MRRFSKTTQILGAMTLICSFFLPFTTAAADESGVVVQVNNDNLAKWAFTLTNVDNIQTQLGKKKVKIEVVAFGPGIFMLERNSGIRQQLDEAMKNGVTFRASEASMREHKLARKDIYPGVTFVPSGVAEIVNKQRDGWAYLKP